MADFSRELKFLEERGLLRSTRPISAAHGAVIRMEGRDMINLASNDYLGLAGHPRIREAAIGAIRDFGWGSGGSRLMSGTTRLHEELEERIAAFKQTEAALLFNSGYAANTGALPALLGSGWIVASDELNHASLIDGLRLCRADVRIFRHGDAKHAEEVLSGSAVDLAIITDGVFSMDGDVAPIEELDAVARRLSALFFIDDAHGTGVIGPGGKGTVSHFGIRGDHVIHMGTLSKALGGIGGFVAGTKDMVAFLRSRARSFIFSTSLPPAACAASLAAFDILDEEGDRLREHLAGLCRRLADSLTGIGVAADATTPIFPIRTGDAKNTLRVAAELDARGFFAPAIRPPTVAENACRVRVSLTAGHSPDMIDSFAHALSEVL